MKISEKTRATIGGLVIIALFVILSWYVRNNMDFVESLISNDVVGIMVLIIIIIIGMILAPISSMPLVPVAANLWGIGLTVVILVFAWTLGSAIVFYIARVFGAPIVKKLFSLKKIREFESKIPEENVLLDLILLRIILPVDILAYALGMLSTVSMKKFILASFIGAIPLALYFSYLGTIPILYQFIGFFVLGFIVVFIQEFRKKTSEKKK